MLFKAEQHQRISLSTFPLVGVVDITTLCGDGSPWELCCEWHEFRTFPHFSRWH